MTRPSTSVPRRQHGVAIITAMLVVSIAAILAVEMMWETSLDLRRTETLLGRDQAQQYALGAEAYAMDGLRTALEQEGAQPVDGLPPQMITFAIEGGTILGCLEDLQGRFNLNNLVNSHGRKDPVAYKQFQRLLEALNNNLQQTEKIDSQLADKVVDWIDPDQTPELDGAEDDIYTSLTPPYRAANFWFTSTSELLAVEGVTPAIYAALAPNVSALPAVGGTQKLNVNTAPVPVLQSIGTDWSESDVRDRLGNELAEPVEDVTVFRDVADPAVLPLLGFTSSYYGLRVLVSIGTTQLSMYSLLERSGPIVTARLRSFDVDPRPPCEIDRDVRSK